MFGTGLRWKIAQSAGPVATTRLVAGAGCERRLSREMITRPRKMRANFDSKYFRTSLV
jgi:hypothetical protein